MIINGMSYPTILLNMVTAVKTFKLQKCFTAAAKLGFFGELLVVQRATTKNRLRCLYANVVNDA